MFVVAPVLPSACRAMGNPLCVVFWSAASTFATDSTVRKPTTPVAMIISAVNVCSLQCKTRQDKLCLRLVLMLGEYQSCLYISLYISLFSACVHACCH